MPVHHRLRLLPFPMRASRLCSLWPAMRPLRFRRVPFGRDVAFDPGGATASRIAMPHMLPSTVPSVSASAKFFLSWLNPPPHPITVYASHPPSPTTAQHSLPGGALPPYRGRSFTGRNASASPDAPEPEVRIHLPPAWSLVRTCGGDARPACAGVGAAGTAFDTSLLRVSPLPLCPPPPKSGRLCRQRVDEGDGEIEPLPQSLFVAR